MRDRSARAMGRVDARGRAWRRADRSRGRAFRNRLERNGFSVETRDARRDGTRDGVDADDARGDREKIIHRRVVVVVVDRDGLTSPSRDGR